jgi:hypothetical protein
MANLGCKIVAIVGIVLAVILGKSSYFSHVGFVLTNGYSVHNTHLDYSDYLVRRRSHMLAMRKMLQLLR